MAALTQTAPPATSNPSEFIRGIGPLAAISLVVGSMIGSGIFIMSADIGPTVRRGARRLLLVWVMTGADDGHRRARLCRAGGDDARPGGSTSSFARARAALRASCSAGPSSR